VVLMREGKRTVLSMQNNYQGPPANFAMVVPVPVVLQKENVKTITKAVFDKIDKLAAPRLVEYWEQDPCYVPPPRRYRMGGRPASRPKPRPAPKSKRKDLGVTIEAQFEVGEYEVVILSAKDSTGLDTWLKQNKYSIPAGAEPVLKPYVQQGMKFFVAKVNAQKVKFVNGQAQLSPLRFHYDTDLFALPVRLGMLNSQGKQDLIVHILAKNQRYEVANYDNVTIPTNFDVRVGTSKRFGEFYAALFDATMKQHPNAVVTEYAWQATKCDPCPGPVMGAADFAALGGDVMPSMSSPQPGQFPGGGMPRRRMRWNPGNTFVLTRLHARYDKNALGEDLVFRKAKPIVGGREMRTNGYKLETSATESSFNNFQGRYIIRHAWKGAIRCKNPVRGRWGGPPAGVQYKGPSAAQNTAFAPRGKVTLRSFVNQSVTNQVKTSKGAPMGLAASIGQGQASPTPLPTPTSNPDSPLPDPAATSTGITPTPAPTGPLPPGPPMAPPSGGGCGGCVASSSTTPSSGWLWLLVGLALGVRRRR
jgi:MYXO-CTERM domain-containing protein